MEMDWKIPKKTYLCPWNRGCLPDYVLQSTPVSNKTQNLDKSQPFSVIISIIESTKIRKIQLVRKYPPFSGQNVLGFCYRSDIRVTKAQRKIGVNIALFLHRFGKYDETV